METRIKTAIPYRGETKIIELFGLTTKGIPGINIVGPRKMTRTLKEKFVYLTRQYNLKLPLNRYHLCVDETIDWKDIAILDVQSVELPLFLMLLKLSGVLKFSNLEECLCAGTITVSGECRSVVFDNEQLEEFEKREYKLITNQKTEIKKRIDLGQILSDIFSIN